jgi:predicted fused transcriptional regulator/phosphomethylpyrimidine kinase
VSRRRLTKGRDDGGHNITLFERKTSSKHREQRSYMDDFGISTPYSVKESRITVLYDHGPLGNQDVVVGGRGPANMDSGSDPPCSIRAKRHFAGPPP